MITKLLRHVGSLALLIVILGFGILLYQLYWPVRTLEYQVPYLHIESANLHPGQTFPLTVNYCKYIDQTETITGRLRSQDTDQLEKQMVSVTNESVVHRGLEQGCHVIHSAIWKTPVDTIPCHTYRVYFDITYQINAFKTIIRHSVTEPFYLKGDTCS